MVELFQLLAHLVLTKNKLKKHKNITSLIENKKMVWYNIGYDVI